MRRARIWEAKIFRLILLAFVSVILPIYVLGYFFYYRGYNGIKDDITSALLSQTVNTVDSLIIDIETIRGMQLDLLTDISLPLIAHRYELMSQFEWFSVVNDFRRKLNAIRFRSPIIADVSIFILPELIQISAASGFDRAEGNDTFETMDIPISRSETGIFLEKDGLYIRSYPVTILDSTFLVTAKIDIAALQSLLSISKTYPDSRMMLLAEDAQTLPDPMIPWDGGNEKVVARMAAGDQEGVFETVHDGTRYLIAYKRSPHLHMTLANYTPVRSLLSPVFAYRIWLAVFTLIGIAAIIVFSFILYLVIEKPLMKIVHAFGLLEAGDLSKTIHHNHDDEFSYLYEAFNDMVIKLKRHIEIEYEHQILLTDAQLNQLQIQINPHFLYNCFFILMGMQNDARYDEAARMVRLLSRYYRYLSQTQSSEVTLEEEITLAQAYCEIQLIRFSSRITVSFIELPAQLKKIKVPLMTLQPLIENAFNHGLKNTDEGGHIKITYSRENDMLRLVVEDNGEDTDDQRILSIQNLLSDSDGEIRSHGLVNVHRRIALRFGTEGISASRSSMGGLKVVVHIRAGDFPDV